MNPTLLNKLFFINAINHLIFEIVLKIIPFLGLYLTIVPAILVFNDVISFLM